MISIVNYGLGNLGSIVNMLKHIGIPSLIVNRPEQLLNAVKIILPGVGAFDAGMANLKKGLWIDILNQKVLKEHIPVLGICLGMQLMTNGSEEGDEEGLGWIDAVTRRMILPQESKFKVPHMGWAEVNEVGEPVFDIPLRNNRFYFAHSYTVKLNSDDHEWLTASYETEICAGFRKKNILGAQFHPEKSHKYGMNFLNKFYFKF